VKDDPARERLLRLFEGARALRGAAREEWLQRECGQDASLLRELRELLHYADTEAGPLPGEVDDAEGERAWAELLESLGRFRPAESRYRVDAEIDSGGQGAIYRVWDRELDRPLAMKVVLSQGEGSPRGSGRSRDTRALARFVDEARITGQLDHPGIVPVHELGIDSDGRVFFTMRLVKGRHLGQVFELARRGAEGWNQTRVLSVLLRVCEAVSYAHARQVIHRDLKPSNVMVGRFGEVYVMDWGLGRKLGAKGGEGAPPPGSETQVEPVRDGESSVLRTEFGRLMGTPNYMPPEQALGDPALLTPKVDVYALGAMLYQLLSGAPPYQRAEDPPGGARRIWERLVEGPPPDLESLAPGAAPELLAICRRAMARDAAQRFASVEDLADDLRGFLEHRVVRSYRTGPWVELQKWVRRNPWVAGSAAAVLLVVVLGGLLVMRAESDRADAAERAADEAQVRILLQDLDRIGPLGPAVVAELEAWIATARGLVARLPALEAQRERFESDHRARPTAPARSTPLDRHLRQIAELGAREVQAFDEYLGQLEGRSEALAADADARRSGGSTHDLWILQRELPLMRGEAEIQEAAAPAARSAQYTESALELEHRRLVDWIERLRRLAAPTGPLAVAEARLAAARGLRARTLEGEAADAWVAARASIADPSLCPPYEGLQLEPQLGLVPLRRDPSSGLWEFWHVLSGAEPQLGTDDRWIIAPETGIVLILVPGGRYTLGAQANDPAGPNYVDPEQPYLTPNFQEPKPRLADEGPVHEAELQPYFLSRYELTQGQWMRLGELNPSTHAAGHHNRDFPRLEGNHPVETVDYEWALVALDRVGLSVPTEAQWEAAARAGESGPFFGGQQFEGCLGAVNFADKSSALRRFTPPADPRIVAPEYDDGCDVHGPVDRFAPNAFGFHNVLGNVWEWCRDWTDRSRYDLSPDWRPSDSGETGELGARISNSKAIRGGSFLSFGNELRLSRRVMRVPTARHEDLGLRPSRPVFRGP
jgi:serine/threonine protein kinase/formylglycine-generating enzyme required for sulfatase activity